MRYLQILSLSLFFISSTLLADHISIAADEWCPYNCKEKGGPKGYMIEIAEEIFKEKGHSVSYHTMNWARAIRDARVGGYTAIVGAFKEDAPDFLFPSIPLGEAVNCFYVKKKSLWKYKKVDSLENQVVGIINDYSYGPVLDAYFKSGKRVAVLSGPTPFVRALEMLKQGRVDTVIEARSVYLHTMVTNNSFAGLFKEAGCDKDKHDVYIAFSPNNPKSKLYREILSKGIERLRKSGRLEKIMKKYGLPTF